MKLFKKNLLYIIILISIFLVTLSFFSIPEIKKTIAIFGIFLLIFSFLLLLIIERNISYIAERIINFANSISEGNFERKRFDSTLNYLNPGLTQSFEKLTSNLQTTFSLLNKEKNQLEAILSAMNEGVIAVTNKGIITQINHAAEYMLEIESDSINKPYWTIIKNKQLQELISETINTEDSLKKEISIVYPEEKFYLATSLSLESPFTEKIIVIFDISEFKKLEKIKADFIANVSHELRTPLTSIKGYTETIEDKAYENEEERNEFLNIINKNADRLINIVSDLLILSELEGRESLASNRNNDIEEIDISELLRYTFTSLGRKFREKDIVESFEIEKNIPKIRANKFLMEQLFTNLIDNAIKYTPYGGQVSAKALTTNGKIKVEISDTGIGIPKEHLDRVFERFYRVDKTRSREIGGTGLGLSIVKHIVLAHNGNINVQSEENKGTTFTIEFPKNKISEF